MSNRSIFLMAALLIWTVSHELSSLPVQAAEKLNDKQINKYSEDENSIRAQASAYVQDFARGDAAAIADMWAPDGTFIDAEGIEYHGRTEIEKLYALYFVKYGKQALDLTINSIRFPAPNVAIEEGITRLTNLPSSILGSKYIVIYVKQNGKWMVSNSSETNIKPISNTESLNDLSWLIGNWTPAFAEGKVLLKMNWFGDNHFINCTFAVHGLPIDEIADVQIIGWDPVRQDPISWNFSASGGFGRALWTKDGDKWLLRAHSVQADGTTGEATYIMHKINKDTFTWQSVKRSLDGCELPDTAEVKLLRETSN